MADIASWNGYTFSVSGDLIRGFTGLVIKAGTKTEEAQNGGSGYVTRKNGNPIQISLNATLNAFTGCRVREEAEAFLHDEGQKNYFYLNGKKAVSCQMMLTEVSVEDIKMAGNGTWTACNVNLTFKQADAAEAEANGSGNGTAPDGKSGFWNKLGSKLMTAAKEKNTTAAAQETAIRQIAKIKTQATAQSAVAKIQAITNAAKKLTISGSGH